MQLQKILLLLVVLLLNVSCTNSKQNETVNQPPPSKLKPQTTKPTPKDTSTKVIIPQTPPPPTNQLCTINGKSWIYTNVIGTVTENRSTGDKTVMFTFNSDPLRETIQVIFSYPEGQLMEVLYNAKRKDNKGTANSLFTYSYNQYLEQKSTAINGNGQIKISDNHLANGNFTAQLELLELHQEKLAANEKPIIEFAKGGFKNIQLRGLVDM